MECEVHEFGTFASSDMKWYLNKVTLDIGTQRFPRHHTHVPVFVEHYLVKVLCKCSALLLFEQ